MKIKRKDLELIVENYLIKEQLALLFTNQINKIKKEALSLHKEAIKISSKEYFIFPHRDAFRHIVGYAFLVHWIKQTFPLADYIGKGIGEAYELKGAIRSYVKGGPFDSGWEMDSANNDIGFDLGLEHDNHEQIIAAAKEIVDTGDFFVEDGKTKYKDCMGDKNIDGCIPTKPKSGSGGWSDEDFERHFKKYYKPKNM